MPRETEFHWRNTVSREKFRKIFRKRTDDELLHGGVRFQELGYETSFHIFFSVSGD